MRFQPRPVDRLLAAYNLLVGVLWLSTGGAAGAAAAGLHVAAAILPWGLDRLAARGFRIAAGSRELYPLALLFGFWTELGHLLPLIHPSTYDALVARWDLALFGRHWSLDWPAAMPSRWLGEVLFFAYLVYLPLIVVPIVVAGARGRPEAMRDMAFRLLATYCACYLIYLAFPVLGPRETIPGAEALVPRGFFGAIADRLRAGGDSLGTAFPSSHAAGAVTIAIAGSRWLSRPVAALLAGQAIAVVLATVYTGNHFAVDAAAGVVLAVAVQRWGVPGLLRWAAPAPALPPVPLLPRFAGGLFASETRP